MELVAKSNGAQTSGCDDKKFKTDYPTADSNEKALKYLKGSIKAGKEILSVAKGKTDQAIRRKGPQNLNPRER